MPRLPNSFEVIIVYHTDSAQTHPTNTINSNRTSGWQNNIIYLSLCG